MMLLRSKNCLLWITLIIPGIGCCQNTSDAAELFNKVRSAADKVQTWRAEFLVTSQLSGRGMNLQNEIQIKISAQPPLKMSCKNSGGDQTMLVCDGLQAFYSGDRNSYDRHDAKVNPDCDYPLSKFYRLDVDPATISIIGRDTVRLSDGPHACVVLQAVWKHDSATTIRTMCIDSNPALILRDVVEGDDVKSGLRMVNTTVFVSYEDNPEFPPDTFKFSIPPGALQSKLPM